MEERSSEQKKAVKNQVARAVDLSAVHTQLRRALPNYDRYRSNDLGPQYRVRGPAGHMWIRHIATELDMWQPTRVRIGDWYARIEEKITPLQAFRRLQPSVEVAKAKRRAREVIITLLLVRHRLKIHAQAPQEIMAQILGHVNEEECEL